MKPALFSVRRSLDFLGVALATMFFALTVSAQFSSVDLSFNPIPAKESSQSLPNFELQPDGKILAFGFSGTRIISGVPKNQIARLNADGSLDNSFDCAACNFNITSARLQPNGKIIVAGNPGSNGASNEAKISRLNADGSVDGSFGSPFPVGNAASSMYPTVYEIQPDGKVLVLIYNSFSGYHQDSIVRLNVNGSYDSSFTTINFAAGRNASEFVSQVKLAADGKIVVSSTARGGFGSSSGYLYRFNADGTNDTTFSSPSLASSTSIPGTAVLDFSIRPDGSIVFVGRFDSVNSVSRISIAKLLPAGNVDFAFPTTNFFTSGTTLSAIKFLPDGKFLINIGYTLQRFNADGSLDNTFNLPDQYPAVGKFVVDAQGRILINLGNYQNGETVYKTFRLNQNGSFDAAFNISVANVGTVSVLASQPDGKVIIGGDFKSVNSVARNNFARVNADGSLDTGFDSGNGFDVAPTKIVVQPNGKILVGGSFTTYNGTARIGLVRLNADGSIDNGFAATLPANAVVNAIALRADGKIYIGGGFSSVNGQTRGAVALLNADGTLDATFNPIFGSAGVYSILIQPDGKVLVGGSFSGVNGFNRSNLVRLNTDGSLDTSFNAGSIAAVRQIELQPNSGKYIVYTDRIFRLNTEGMTDAAFQTAIFYSTNNSTLTFIVQPDDSIIVGGAFNDTVNGYPRANLARLKADGTPDTFFLQSGTNGAVSALARTLDGKLLVGGSFSIISGVSRIGIARLTIAPIVTTRAAKPFDFDGDGRADLSVFRPSSGTWYIARPTGTPSQNYDALQFGISSDKLVPADYDGDGKADVAVFRNGTWYVQRSALGFISVEFGTTGDTSVPADYNGDGRADFAVFRPSNGTWYIARPTGTPSQNYDALQFGISSDKLVPADYDGDGKADVAVFRNGTWYVQRSALGFISVEFGTTGDTSVPADYNGDGRADFAVFRPSSGTWYIARPTGTPSQNYDALQFGISSDKLVPADYDGDGKADVAVFRNGTWYLNRSTAGFTGVSFGISEDNPAPAAFVR